jgi:hypothetical protein
MMDDDKFRQETRKELEELLQVVIDEFLQPDTNQLVKRETTPK